MSSGNLLTTFTGCQNDLQWRIVNDNVMGGQSNGDFEISDGLLIFTGSTNTNGGGFSSVRSIAVPLSISDADDGFELNVRADGRRYIFRIETSEGVAYWADFPTSSDWQVSRVPFSRFRPRRRGQWLSGPELEPAKINSLGLMIYDGQDGPFHLEVDRIGTCSESTDASDA